MKARSKSKHVSLSDLVRAAQKYAKKRQDWRDAPIPSYLHGGDQVPRAELEKFWAAEECAQLLIRFVNEARAAGEWTGLFFGGLKQIHAKRTRRGKR